MNLNFEKREAKFLEVERIVENVNAFSTRLNSLILKAFGSGLSENDPNPELEGDILDRYISDFENIEDRYVVGGKAIVYMTTFAKAYEALQDYKERYPQ